jgi:hypothetical protein
MESGIPDELLDELRDYGATTDNSLFYSSWQNLSGSYFELKLFSGRAYLRLWPNLVEIHLSSQGVGDFAEISPQSFSEIFAPIIERVLFVLNGKETEVANHSINFHAHGGLRDRSVLSLIGNYIKSPLDGFGSIESAAFRLAFEREGDVASSWLVLEPSLVLKDGLYLNVGVTLDGDRTPAAEVSARALQLIMSMIELPSFPVRMA